MADPGPSRRRPARSWNRRSRRLARVIGQQPARPLAGTFGVTPAVAHQLNLPAGGFHPAPGPAVRARETRPEGVALTRPPLIGAPHPGEPAGAAAFRAPDVRPPLSPALARGRRGCPNRARRRREASRARVRKVLSARNPAQERRVSQALSVPRACSGRPEICPEDNTRPAPGSRNRSSTRRRPCIPPSRGTPRRSVYRRCHASWNRRVSRHRAQKRRAQKRRAQRHPVQRHPVQRHPVQKRPAQRHHAQSHHGPNNFIRQPRRRMWWHLGQHLPQTPGRVGETAWRTKVTRGPVSASSHTSGPKSLTSCPPATLRCCIRLGPGTHDFPPYKQRHGWPGQARPRLNFSKTADKQRLRPAHEAHAQRVAVTDADRI